MEDYAKICLLLEIYYAAFVRENLNNLVKKASTPPKLRATIYS